MTNPVRSSKRGVTRRGGLLMLLLGVMLFFAGGAMYAFVSADLLLTRLFPFLAVSGLVVALVGMKNVLLPSSRHDR